MSEGHLYDRRLLLAWCSVVVTACNAILSNDVGHLGASSAGDAGGAMCFPDSKRCSGNGVQTCQIDETWGVAVPCPYNVCVGRGICSAQPGCAGVPATCGPTESGDCCASNPVPDGTFYRSNDANYPAAVSAFHLDNYEITVGRFRKFVAGYPGNLPLAGAGKNPNDAQDPGWDGSWNAEMLADATALTSMSGVKCDANQTWTDVAGGNESRAMVCITWYEAYAFCIWDGGRLPTEAEWNYAAAGGGEQREFPWSNPPSDVTIDDTYAVFYLTTQNVGSKSPKGDGKWGQSDLAGNVNEWVTDWYWYATYSNPCINCFNSTTAIYRVLRGGGFNDEPSYLLASSLYRSAGVPSGRHGDWGARCARTP